MKRRNACLALSLVCAAGLGACVPMGEIHDRAALQEREGPEVTRFGDVAFREIAPGVWQHTTYLDLPGFGSVPSNGLLVVQGGRSVLIDTAWTDSQTAQILAWADGVLERPVTAALFTHSHQDKMGGIGALHTAGVETWANPLTNELAVAEGLQPARNTCRFDTKGWREGGGGQAFPRLAIYFPGGAHTRDNLVVGIPEAGIVFAGCMIKGTDSDTLGNLADADTAGYADSVRRVMLAFPEPYGTVVMSHSQPEDRGALRHTLALAEDLSD